MKFFKFKQSWLSFSVVALMLPSFCALASDDLDVTMRMVIDDEGLTDTVVREIRLNTPIGLEEKLGQGSDVAREAREKGREFGQAAAEKAKETAREKKDGARPGRPDLPSAAGSGNQPD